jgi:hypothetical protein
MRKQKLKIHEAVPSLQGVIDMLHIIIKAAFPRRSLTLLTIICCIGEFSYADDSNHIVEIHTVGHRNWKMESFSLDRKLDLYIHARGAEPQLNDLTYAYAWILNAQSRKVVWEMDVDNTSRKKHRRETAYEGPITLPKGDYEVYFAITTFIKDIQIQGLGKLLEGIFQGLQGMSYSKDWGITIDVVNRNERKYVHDYDPQSQEKSVLIQMTGVGDDAFRKEGFTLKKPVTLRIYAVGEGNRSILEMCDYGWIMDSRSRKRVWEMTTRNTDHAGGADKNVLYNDRITLPTGSYLVYYVTDGSHSCEGWNAQPPYDPLHWGITLWIDDPDFTAQDVVPFTRSQEKKPVIEIVRMRDNELRSEGFTLLHPTDLQICALGEFSSDMFYDYGIILDAHTREKVWTMTPYNTRHAGGGKKNRLYDDIVRLPAGDYIVYYITDNSHSYQNWNAGPPYDPEAWGITIWIAGDDIDPKDVKTYSEEEDPHLLTHLIGLGDNEKRTERFRLDATTRIRIYAIGEGDRGNMYDYGWIENEKGQTVWEMTYRNTEHAGGAKKNRLFNDTILLEEGMYILHFNTDGSHSFNKWNSNPPNDPFHWGVTVMKEES